MTSEQVTATPALDGDVATATVDDGEQRLTVAVHLSEHNPYEYMLPRTGLAALFLDAGTALAQRILANLAEPDETKLPIGKYTRDSFAVVLGNAIIWPWTPPEHLLLGAVLIGTEAERYLPFAGCKALNAMRLGGNYGDAVNTNPLLCGNGNFVWGHNGVGVFPNGGSGFNANQDQREASRTERDIARWLLKRHERWCEANPGFKWFHKFNEPDPMWARMTGLLQYAGTRVIGIDGGAPPPAMPAVAG